MSSRTYFAVLAATTILAGAAGSAAIAADAPAAAPSATPPGHAAAIKDFGKLSADGARAYQDLTLARLAIFDGRVGDAKRYVADADAGFNKAKTDESVFTQAEASMRSHMAKGGQGASAGAKAGTTSDAGAAKAGDQAAPGNADAAGGDDVNKPIAWLPVDGTVSINEDFSLKPAKAKAVKDANESLAKGDRKGAMEKLKLADVDTTVTLAVVPLQQTLADVDAAKQLIDGSKYYEGSQKLRAVQDATLFTVAAFPTVPAQAQPAAQGGGSGAGR